MNIKNVLKYLPVVSLLNHLPEIPVFSSSVKTLGHLTYAFIGTGILISSLFFGTPNVLRWNEISERREKARQEYNQLYDRAEKCVEQDGLSGLTSLREVNDLYSRAGKPIRIDRGRFGEIIIPEPTRENLEKVVQSCEAEVK